MERNLGINDQNQCRRRLKCIEEPVGTSSSSSSSCSPSLAPGEVILFLAGSENWCDDDSILAEDPLQLESNIKSNGIMLMKSHSSDEGIYDPLNLYKKAFIRRLEELTSMDPTVEVGLEMADSVCQLKLTNSANPEMERAAEKSSRGARLLKEGAKLVGESQQIMKSAIANEKRSSSTLSPQEIKFYDILKEIWGLLLSEHAPLFCFFSLYILKEILGPLRGTEELQAPSKTFQGEGLFDYGPLVNHGIYASVKSQVIGGKGTRTQSSSTTQQ